MNETSKNLLICELAASKAYIDRLFHACIEVKNLVTNEEFMTLSAQFVFDIENFIEEKLLKDEFASNSSTPLLHPKEMREKIIQTTTMLQNFLSLNYNIEAVTRLSVDFINLLYSHAHKLHIFCHKKTDLLIVYPTLNVLAEKGKTGDIVSFFLDENALSNISKRDNLSSLNAQREKSYLNLVRQGHQALYEKRPQKALEFFKKAQGYNESAEVLSLIAWSYSLLDNLTLAKEYALKAIEADSDHGTSYNDLGTYYLADNDIDEASKWFQRAKEARDYQHKEFPYINMGKIYIIQGRYQDALEEFSYALTLAPYNEELKEALRQLQKLMNKKSKLDGVPDDLPK